MLRIFETVHTDLDLKFMQVLPQIADAMTEFILNGKPSELCAALNALDAVLPENQKIELSKILTALLHKYHKSKHLKLLKPVDE